MGWSPKVTQELDLRKSKRILELLLEQLKNDDAKARVLAGLGPDPS